MLSDPHIDMGFATLVMDRLRSKPASDSFSRMRADCFGTIIGNFMVMPLTRFSLFIGLAYAGPKLCRWVCGY